ncbi:hypothetical protein MVEG_07809 [Podila verticillata NRRL 6337]|nr:hypothetical protein MVEG_07809 [Podila verticillata NRRL 6337]
MTPDEQQPNSTGTQPHIIIVGAGIAGMILAILLDKAGVPYTLLEKASRIKALGSAISFGPTVIPLFRQIGIFEEFEAIALPFSSIRSHDGEGNLAFTSDFEPRTEMGGARTYIVARPKIYDILYNKIPKEKVLLNKRVLSVTEDDRCVRVECADGTFYEGDILVGADGAYSAVRQSIFKQLKKENKLPLTDDTAMPYNCVCLVGQTQVLDEEEFSVVGSSDCKFNNYISRTEPYFWVIFNTKQKTICWTVIQILNETSSKDLQESGNKGSEWGPEAAGAMAETVRHFRVPNGENHEPKTLGDLIDKTDKELISKVSLEEKVFESWYSSRTVLIGDACHKTNPAGGLGAQIAVHDAICVANWINALPSNTSEDIQHAFKNYKEERYPYALAAYKNSNRMITGNENTIVGMIIRLIRYYMPTWLWLRALKRTILYRPQVSFLPKVDDKGSVLPIDPPSFVKTKYMLEKKGRNPSSQEPSSAASSSPMIEE